MTQSLWNWIVFILSAGAYIPLAIGGWDHPAEINVASYCLWLILSGMLLYSSYSQGFSGWRLPLGYLIGNLSMIILGIVTGGYTFNVGPVESVVLFGLIITVFILTVVGKLTGKFNSRIIFIGAISADVVSFYPQIKQYLMPHDFPTNWMLVGWGMWIAGVAVNIILVERLFKKLCKSEGQSWKIIEESLFSIENGIFMIITTIVMTC